MIEAAPLYKSNLVFSHRSLEQASSCHQLYLRQAGSFPLEQNLRMFSRLLQLQLQIEAPMRPFQLQISKLIKQTLSKINNPSRLHRSRHHEPRQH